MEGILINVLAVAVLLLIPAWRIFRRAGFAPATALVVLVPYVGPLIATGILAFAEWPGEGDAGGGQAGGL
jgi:hypothetical protein